MSSTNIDFVIQFQGMKWKDFINQKYLDWRGDKIGNDGSITQFAIYVGVSQQLMNKWLAGSVPTQEDKIERLVELYGDEVLIVLGKLQDEVLITVPKELRQEFVEARKEWVTQWLAERGVKEKPESRRQKK